MKRIILAIALFITINATAQDDKTVTLTITGQGKTIEEAKQNALRSAIEQAFGTFISSNTTILDDKLVKDEIVSITNGNIQKFDVLNETPLPDGGGYLTTLKAIVSVNKLTSFCESKGVSVEFKGGLFAMNMALQEFNEKSELKAWENTYDIIIKLLRNSFDYKIAANTPTIFKDIKDVDKWKVPIDIELKTNNNYKLAIDILVDFCKSTNLNKTEIENIAKVGKKTYSFNINDKQNALFNVSFRNNSIRYDILKIPILMTYLGISNIVLDNGIEKKPFFYYTSTAEGNKKIDLDDVNPMTMISKSPNLIVVDKSKDYMVYKDIIMKHNIFIWKNKIYVGSNLFNGQISVPTIYEVARQNDEIIKNFIRKTGNDSYYKLDNMGWWSETTVNYYNLDNFFEIKFNQVLTLEEINKIKEYKIEILKAN